METAQPIDPRSQEKTDSPDIIWTPENSSRSWEAAALVSQNAEHRAIAASKRQQQNPKPSYSDCSSCLPLTGMTLNLKASLDRNILSIIEQIYKKVLQVAVLKLEMKGYSTESGLFSLHQNTAEPTLARSVESK